MIGQLTCLSVDVEEEKSWPTDKSSHGLRENAETNGHIGFRVLPVENREVQRSQSVQREHCDYVISCK